MLLLSLDTSTTVCSAALHQDGVLLGCYELFTERTSSAMLTTLINEVVQHTGHELNQVDAIAVGKGPGSYTGLRIGVSTAKGLCFALDKPLLSVNTLAGMAEQVRAFYPASYTLCPLIDARRMEVYGAFYSAADGRELQATAAEIIDEQSFSNWLANGPVVFFGDGATKCRAVLGNHPYAMFLDKLITPSARTVGALAGLAFAEGRFEDVATFEPFYLKEFMTARPKPVVF
ncbi:tRNA (adenosine(37)-N6)-threonylcarbamoyltransferase complex dimerization subunit type 1 TsaB [Nostoc sp. CHAB 5834]|nr:tRNA (adenosine(37)-N6)-threonylcarbamoyltransferase complex dimerization subunit type 1 TsaB [Nostoc sp. CHAB 5834]